MVREEQQVRELQGDMLNPPNPFENGIGHFWGIHGTRPYMRARLGLIDALVEGFALPGGQKVAVESILDHLLDMLRLCRGDNMGLRDMIPALYIRLGKDQVAYDFMKWYATTGQESDYDWGDMDLPFLDVKDADALESPEGLWSRRFSDLSHMSSVTLIKLRILLDLQAIQAVSGPLEGRMPQEIIELVRSELVGSIVETRPEVLRGDTAEMERLIQAAETQIADLHRYVDQANPHFWRHLISNPAAAAAAPPEAYATGSPSEARLMLRYNYSAWAETPWAIEYIRKLSGGA